MLATAGRRGGGRKFSRHTIPKLHVFNLIFLKSSKFPNKKGTFHHKKGHFWSLEKIGGGGHVAPPVPTAPGLKKPICHQYGNLYEIFMLSFSSSLEQIAWYE